MKSNRTTRSLMVLVCLAATLSGTLAAGPRDRAVALSREPVGPDPAWRQQVLDTPGPFVRPVSVTVEGDGGTVTGADGVLRESGPAATLTATAPRGVRMVIDLGVLAGGYVELGVRRASGAPIRASYAEARRYLTADGDADPDPGGFFYQGRSLGTDDDPDGRADVFPPPGAPTVLRSAGLRGSQRYVGITLDGPGSLVLDFVRVRKTTFRGAYDGHFLSSDPVLNRAWYASAYGLDMSTARGRRTGAGRTGPWVVMDGPKRDRTVYAGDVQLVALAAYQQGGAYRRVLRDTISLFACQQLPDGTLPVTSRIDVPCDPGDPGPPDGSPAGFEPPGEAAKVRLDAFTLLWVISVADYLRFTGDSAFVRPLLPVARRALRFFDERASHADGGLFRTADYDGLPAQNWHTPDRAAGVDATTNAAYFAALRSLARLTRSVAGDRRAAAALDRRAVRVRSALLARLWDPAAGAMTLNTDDPRRDHTADANAAALAFGVLDSARARRAITHLDTRLSGPYGTLTTRLADNPYMTRYVSPYVMAQESLGRFRYGDGAGALRLIRAAWGHMIRNGPGTAWEEVGADGEPAVPRPGTSLAWGGHVGMAHAWSTAVPALSMAVLGVRPLGDGYRTWAVEPDPVDLAWAQGDVPVPAGTVSSRWRRGAGDDSFVLTVRAPDGTAGRVAVPLLGQDRTIAVNGRIAWRDGHPAGNAGHGAHRVGDAVVFEGISGTATFAWAR
ncbi:alpha-L-rhamnosidase C-terminal domain-containing protein [Streptomyces hygroscopicus]|uniref:alpha-L-rhamnosidase C-terminal domain-containing protein n=1 Tax=Streptomyces hygroscopicus TaxID=1912 RepID=UPI003643BA31